MNAGLTMNDEPRNGKPRRRWPLFVLAAVVLFLALNFYWLSREVQRIRRYRASFAQQTNAPPQPADARK